MIKKILFCVIASLIILVLAGNVSAKTFHMIGGEWLSDDEYEPIRLRNFWGGISCTPCEIEEMQVGYVIRGGERVPSYKNMTIEIDEMKCEENKVYQCQRVIRVKGVSSKEEAQEKLNNAMSEFEGKIEECEEQKIGSGVKQIYRWILKEDCGMDRWCREFHKITKAKNYLSSSIKFEEFDNSPGNQYSPGSQYCHSSYTVQYFLNKWGNCDFRIINREQEKCTNTETGEYPDYHDEFAKKSEIYTVLDEIRVHGKLCKAADTHGSRVQLAACEDMWKCGDGIDNDADDFYEDEKGIRSPDTDDITDWFKINLRFRGDVKYHNAGGTDCEDRHNCEGNICKVIRIPSTQEEAEEINMQQEVFEYNCYSIRIDHLAEGGVSTGYPSDWTEKVGMCIPTCDEACRKHVYNTNYKERVKGKPDLYRYNKEEPPEARCYRGTKDLIEDISHGHFPRSDEDKEFGEWLLSGTNPPSALNEDLINNFFHLSAGDPYCISQDIEKLSCYCRKIKCPTPLRLATGRQLKLPWILKHKNIRDIYEWFISGDIYSNVIDLTREGYTESYNFDVCGNAGLSDKEIFYLGVYSSIISNMNTPGSILYTGGNYEELISKFGDEVFYIDDSGDPVTLKDFLNYVEEKITPRLFRTGITYCPIPQKKSTSSGKTSTSTKDFSIYVIGQKVLNPNGGVAYQFNPANINFNRYVKITFKNTSSGKYVYGFHDEDVLMFCDAEILSEKTKTIGPAGGSIHTEDVILDIPENALSEDVEIKIRKLNLTCDISREREIDYSLIDYYGEPAKPSPIISADINNDGKVDDKEILIFIDKATREGVSRTKIMEEINKWKYF